MRILLAVVHGARRVLVSVATLVAVGALAVFGLAHLGVINPLVVISGSMEPGISRGDLLIDTRVPVADLHIGQVVSIAPVEGHLPVSHRIVDIRRDADGDTALLQLKGDANASVDAPVYRASGEAWVPRWRIPLAGYVITKLIRPAVMVPLAVALAALIVFVLVPPAPRGTRGVRGRRPSGERASRRDGRATA